MNMLKLKKIKMGIMCFVTILSFMMFSGYAWNTNNNMLYWGVVTILLFHMFEWDVKDVEEADSNV